MNFEQVISEFFTQYAYQPMYVYFAVMLIMTASSFGFPVPEEFTLVSAGLIAYMGMNPDRYPPPMEGMEPVNLYVLSTICFIAVLGSDLLIYGIGRYMGPKLFETNFFKNKIGVARIEKIHSWFQKWGMWVCGVFRFTPGIRFPGHMSCGAMGVPAWKFVAVDGFAALISVPTQVLLVAYYGEIITSRFKEFKIILFSILALVVIVYFVKKKLTKSKVSS
jgi:membrane protein DedA with SNARE-associated domain